MSKRFIGEQGLNQLMNNVKSDLNEKLNISDQITEEELVKQWNSVLGDELPNTNSLAHNHDERYYNKEEIDTKLENIPLTSDDIEGIVPDTRMINNKPLSEDITLVASDVSAVPNTRTVNGKSLSKNIVLSASDVSAVPNTRTVNGKSLSKNIVLSASDVKALPITGGTINGEVTMAGLVYINYSGSLSVYNSIETLTSNALNELGNVAIGASINYGSYALSSGHGLAVSPNSVAFGSGSLACYKPRLYKVKTYDIENHKLIIDTNSEYSTDLNLSKIFSTHIAIIYNDARSNSYGIARILKVDNEEKSIYFDINDINVAFRNYNDIKYIAANYSANSSGNQSIATGFKTIATGINSISAGNRTIAFYDNQLVIGTFNRLSSDGSFIVGNGTSEEVRSNAFRVAASGGVYAKGEYHSTGADYAEMFEYEDGNPNNEDRVGRFVTLIGKNIRLSNESDKRVLGVISGAPTVVGDVYDDQWKGMFMYDIYGRPILEEVTIPEEVIEEPDPDNPDNTITRVVQEQHTEIVHKVNPNYNPNEKYIPRSQRKEWGTVGMMGKLTLIDDGTCIVNGYAKPYKDGIATKSDEETNFYVMDRLDDNHVQILIYPHH